MSQEDNVKEVTKLEKWLKNQGRQDFIDKIRNSTNTQMEAEILKLAKHKQDIMSTKAKDEELKKARENVRGLNAPYAEQGRFNDKMTRFAALVLEEKGGN